SKLDGFRCFEGSEQRMTFDRLSQRRPRGFLPPAPSLSKSIFLALFTLVSETGILGCRPGDLAMDDGSFASWLGAIRLLTDVQRRTGFMCLALAEADDDVAVVSAEVEQRLPPSVEEISGAIDGE